MQKKEIISVEHEYKIFELPAIEGYFSKGMNKKKRNMAIVKAVNDGHRQVVVANELSVNASMISKVVQKWKDSSPDPKDER